MGVWVYLLRCRDGSYFAGHAEDLKQQLELHQTTACAYTSTRLPVELVYWDKCRNRSEAMGREQQMKSWSRNRKASLPAISMHQLDQMMNMSQTGS